RDAIVGGNGQLPAQPTGLGIDGVDGAIAGHRVDDAVVVQRRVVYGPWGRKDPPGLPGRRVVGVDAARPGPTHHGVPVDGEGALRPAIAHPKVNRAVGDGRGAGVPVGRHDLPGDPARA